MELSYVYIPEQEKKGCGMMKLSRNALIRMVLFLIMLLCAGSAHAEYVRTDTIHDSLPQVTIRITDTGERDESYERENLLRVSISTEDHSIAQELSYRSSENASHDGAAALARLEDVNFDGYQDLLLLTAQGARNVFYAVSVYHPDENRFMPVLQTVSWETEIHSFNWEEVTQLELCNEQLYGEKRLISSSVADGYQFLTEIVYQWQGGYTLEPVGVTEIYDAGSGMIGEMLEMYATGIRRCWDEQYPEEWYYGQEGVYAERRAACRLLTLGDGVTNPEFKQVANVDWVNLRRQDSKSSPSLARLDAGTPVQVLGKSAVEDGWIRVFVWPEGNAVGMTGYIWHSYLE